MDKLFDIRKILIDRNEYIVFQAEKYTDQEKGWIGGNAPKYFIENNDFFVKYKDTHYFYLTFINPFDNKNMFSIFVPKEKRQLFNNNIYPCCSILLFEHLCSGESNNTGFTNAAIMRHSISSGKVVPNVEPHYNDDGDVTWISNGKVISNDDYEAEPFLIKVGGTPVLIQDERYYYERLHENGFEFLFQIDEDGYPPEFIKGNYPFCFGAVYVYAKIINDSVQDPCVGYWQFS